MDKVVTADQTILLSTIAKRRMRTSREEMAVLDEQYRKNPNPNLEEKKEIAHKLKMGVKNVHFWFQNKRAKENKNKKLLLQKKQKQASSSPAKKQHYLRSCVYQAASSQPSSSSGQKMQLPPISDIIAYPIQDLSIPFYFYHAKFGIEDSLIQWIKGREKNS
ncbi:hypothetical protein BY458DRAFT_26046 [Sporodiniella umbellata]|nr:hypothetical protein BY458DRAFT_26046 [Sporodiniella umbellata]